MSTAAPFTSPNTGGFTVPPDQWFFRPTVTIAPPAPVQVFEFIITDPKTGGAKGSKAEDYSQIPPLPLAHTLDILAVLQGNPVKIPARWPWRDFLGEGDRGHLARAAAAAIAQMGGKAGFDAVARIYHNGGLKYADANWCKGYSWRLTVAAAWRHLVAWETGDRWNIEKFTKDGVEYTFTEPHLAHFVWHCFTLYEYHRLGLGTDDLLFFEDRYGRPAPEKEAA